jgi:ABC-type dipeptide/oligopeptide/nickel transport system permease component
MIGSGSADIQRSPRAQDHRAGAVPYDRRLPARLSRLVAAFSMIGLVPVFIAGYLLIYLFSELKLFPVRVAQLPAWAGHASADLRATLSVIYIALITRIAAAC